MIIFIIAGVTILGFLIGVVYGGSKASEQIRKENVKEIFSFRNELLKYPIKLLQKYDKHFNLIDEANGNTTE